MTATPSPRYLSPSGWNALLPAHEGAPLRGDMTADLIVVGAGYTGLAAARRWAELAPESSVLVLEALTLGEGNPGRNSGFLLEVAMAEDAQASAVARLGECNRLLSETMADISRLVAESDVPCELVRRGTYRAAVGEAARKSLAGYRRFLDAAGLPYAALDREALAARIGTRFYTEGLYSPDCHLAQPAALIRALASTLPESVQIIEQACVDGLVKEGDGWRLTAGGHQLKAPQVILANNAFAKALHRGAGRVVAMYTSAGITEPLSAADLAGLGSDENWGLLPAHRLGATLRRTSDGRLLVRTFHSYEREEAPASLPERLREYLKRRFPQVTLPEFVTVWSGAVGYTQGGGPHWGALDEKLWVSAGCNGGGVVKGTLFGRALAERALALQAPGGRLPGVEPCDVEGLFGLARWLPPDPLRRIGYQLAAGWEARSGAMDALG
jgi:glycine/D-amino acid oxidase-like deaminating enzyme